MGALANGVPHVLKSTVQVIADSEALIVEHYCTVYGLSVRFPHLWRSVRRGGLRRGLSPVSGAIFEDLDDRVFQFFRDGFEAKGVRVPTQVQAAQLG
jgi:hypothetical protein